jgi:DTW domain-containing protein YfiP
VDEGRAILLFPSSSAQDPQTILERLLDAATITTKEPMRKPLVLIALDGTWREVKYLYRWNPRLQTLPTVRPSRLIVVFPLMKLGAS